MDGWTFVASAGTKFVFHALFCFSYYFDYFFTWFYEAMTNSHRDLIKGLFCFVLVFFCIFGIGATGLDKIIVILSTD